MGARRVDALLLVVLALCAGAVCFEVCGSGTFGPTVPLVVVVAACSVMGRGAGTSARASVNFGLATHGVLQIACAAGLGSGAALTSTTGEGAWHLLVGLSSLAMVEVAGRTLVANGVVALLRATWLVVVRALLILENKNQVAARVLVPVPLRTGLRGRGPPSAVVPALV